MTAAQQVNTSVFDQIPLEDRLYPMPLLYPTEQKKPEHLREYRQAIKMGAKRLAGASFLVVPPEADAETKSRLRLNFGGALRKRRREEAIAAMQQDRLQEQAVEDAARERTGPEARLYFYTTPGEGEFGVETLKEIAKASDIKTFFDGTRRLRYMNGEEVPEVLRRFVSEEARRAYEGSFADRGEDMARRKEGVVTSGVKEAEAIVAKRVRGIVLADPAKAPQQFAQDVLGLADLSAKELTHRIGETVAELRKTPADEGLQRSVRVAFAVMLDATDRPPSDLELGQAGVKRSDLPEEAMQGPMPDEARLMRVAYGYDVARKPVREPDSRVVPSRPKSSGRGFSMFDR